MEENQEQGHMCRFCDKYFPCGRSLGGHMRSHMRNGPLKKKEKLERKTLACSASNINGGSNTSLVDFEEGEQAGYGLRENPKKTWRLSDYKEDKFGKGFQPSKALFGHMASHTEKERVCDSLEEESWIDGHMDSQSETETAAPKRGRRSRRRARYKNTSTVTASSSLSLSFANASGYVSEIEQEQDEVARCLMMLSRDVGCWGGVKSVSLESSDNNYVAGEVRLVKENSELELKNNSELGQPEFGGSRDVLYNKKLESGVPVYGPTTAHKFKKPKSGFEVAKVELGDFYSKKKMKYECAVCRKVFKSYQALGGHRASHKRSNSCCAFRTESAETSIETNSPNTNSSIDRDGGTCVEATLKKTKHECPTCFKVFASGQALGGHKRSHVENRERQTPQQLPVILHLLDLNLPAQDEEESNVGIGFEQWWGWEQPVFY